MGIRVEFWEIPQADIKRAVIDDFSRMKNWYESIGNEFPEDLDYELLENLENIVDPEHLFEEFDEHKIDELVALYIGDYCDLGHGKMSPVKGTSMLYIRHYNNDQGVIDQKCSLETRQLWNYILKGRSVTESLPFKIEDPIFRFCIFTEPECQALFEDLVSHFDTSGTVGFNNNPGIGSVIQALQNKKGEGILITVA